MSHNERRARGAASGAVLALASLGLAMLVWGSWIPAKAWLAQQLIARAWQARTPGAPAPAPWSWADTRPVARLIAPGHHPDGLYVLDGASGQSLAFGPAHVRTSALPGEPDNVAIAGHRDTHFAFLEQLAPGDPLVLESATRRRRYRVEHAAVVHESRVDLLARRGRSELTLVTCHPFDAIVPGGPMRYVVRAVEIDGASDRPAGRAAADDARANNTADARR